LAFLQTLPQDGNPCQFGSVDITAVIADLTSDADLESPTISDAQIYHDSGFGCTGTGHFRAEVDVYAPGTTVSSVSIASSNTTSLGGDGVHALTADGTRWVSQASAEGANGICVTFNSEVTYTITSNLANGSTLTDTVTRNHPNVPEADTTVNGEETSNDVQNPDVLTDKRPVYEWESPEEKLATITGAPAGSVVKYTYEFSHVNGSAGQTSPLTGCDMQSSGALYSVNNFMPTVDCDPEACATSSGVAADDIVCRMNIQTFLVDAYDRYLGQAAGHFPVFCVDTSSPADGDCGN
ncbi:MAG: hypothetical protein Q7T11_06450, partial [Deltaproteobacteria bacterium]|nr:hypothetical protein [Deltaproteobacteria bacterium]